MKRVKVLLTFVGFGTQKAERDDTMKIERIL